MTQPHIKQQGALNAFISSLRLLESISDAVSVPYLRGLVGTAITVAETIKGAKHNKEACYTLGHRINTLVFTAYSELHTHGSGYDPSIGVRVEALMNSLLFVHVRVSTLAGQSFIRRALNNTTDAEAVADFEREVNEFIQLFTLQTEIASGLDLKCLRDDNVRKRILEGGSYGEWRSDHRCLPNTRTRYLNDILQWSRSSATPAICWLNGVAGSGKTSISHEIAALHHEENGIYACFFFNRDDPAMASSVVQLLAYGLAYAPELRTHITAVMQRMADTRVLRTLTEQFQASIVAPLRNCLLNHPNKRVLLVLDALDECPQQLRFDLLQALREGVPRLPPNVKVFITSRPQLDISASVEMLPAKQLHVQVGSGLDDGDVMAFVLHELRNIRATRRLSSSWPEHQLVGDAKALSDKAAGLFQWARVTCTLLQNRFSPRDVIKRILRLDSGGQTDANLDTLYTEALQVALPAASSDPELQAAYSTIIGTVIYAKQPLGVAAISEILDMDESIVIQLLTDVGCVISVEDSGARIVHIAHPSFFDYITDRDRCQDPTFFIDKAPACQIIAGGCLALMVRSLRRDLCGTRYPHLDNSDIPLVTLAQCIPDTLRYSCRYGLVHVVEHPAPILLDRLNEFLRTKLLEWIEAMSLLGLVEVAASVLRQLQSSGETMGSLVPSRFRTEIVYDAIRLVAMFGQVIAQSALHVYFSALPFTPPDTALFQTYCTYDGIPIVTRSMTGRRTWSKILFSMPLTYGSIDRLSFSEDSTNLLYTQDRSFLQAQGIGQVSPGPVPPAIKTAAVLSSLTGRHLWKDRSVAQGPVTFTSSHLAFIKGNELLVVIDLTTGLLTRFSASEDGKTLTPVSQLVGNEDKRPTRRWCNRLPIITVSSLAFDHSGSSIFIGLSNGGVEYWTKSPSGWQRELSELYSHGSPVLALRTSMPFVASVCMHKLHVFKCDSNELHTASYLPDAVSDPSEDACGLLSFASGPDGQWTAAVRAARPSSSYFGHPAFSLFIFSSHHDGCIVLDVAALCFAVSLDTQKVITIDVSLEKGYSGRMWDAASGAQLCAYELVSMANNISAVNLSPDGNLITTVEGHGSRLVMREADFPIPRSHLPASTRNSPRPISLQLLAVAVSSGQNSYVTETDRASIMVSRLHAGERTSIFTVQLSPDIIAKAIPGHRGLEGVSTQLAVSPDVGERYIAVCCMWSALSYGTVYTFDRLSQRVRVWNISQDRFTTSIARPVFSPSGTKMAIFGWKIEGSYLSVFDLSNGDETKTRLRKYNGSRIDASSCYLRFSPDGDAVLVVEAATVRLFNLNTGVWHMFNAPDGPELARKIISILPMVSQSSKDPLQLIRLATKAQTDEAAYRANSTVPGTPLRGSAVWDVWDMSSGNAERALSPSNYGRLWLDLGRGWAFNRHGQKLCWIPEALRTDAVDNMGRNQLATSMQDRLSLITADGTLLIDFTNILYPQDGRVVSSEPDTPRTPHSATSTSHHFSFP